MADQHLRFRAVVLFSVLSIVIASLAIFAGFSGVLITGQTTYATGAVDDCSLRGRIDVMAVDGLDMLCYTDSSIIFSIENSGSKDVAGLKIALVADYPAVFDVYGVIAPGDVADQSIYFGEQTLSGVKEVSITPMFTSDAGIEACDALKIGRGLRRCV